MARARLMLARQAEVDTQAEQARADLQARAELLLTDFEQAEQAATDLANDAALSARQARRATSLWAAARCTVGYSQ